MIEDELDLEEESDSAAICPHCGQEDECEHLLAYCDETFGEFLGGFAYDRPGEKTDVLNTAFLRLLDAGKGLEIDWGYEEVEEAIAMVWEDAVDEYATDGEILVGSEPIEMVLLSDVTSLDVTVVTTVSDGAPGMSAKFVRVYATNPKKEFNSAVSCLEEILKDKLQEFLVTAQP